MSYHGGRKWHLGTTVEKRNYSINRLFHFFPRDICKKACLEMYCDFVSNDVSIRNCFFFAFRKRVTCSPPQGIRFVLSLTVVSFPFLF